MQYDIIDIEGIGNSYAELLNEVGIKTTYDFVYYNIGAINVKLDRSISTTLLKKWQQMCKLTILEGLNPQYAEALVNKKVTSFAKLKNLKIDTISKKFDEAKSESIIPDTPSNEDIEDWVQSAKIIEKTTSVFGQVVDLDGNPIADARITIGDISVTSGKNGGFAIMEISPWDNEFSVEVDGFYSIRKTFIPQKKEQTLKIALVKSQTGKKSPLYVDALQSGHVTLVKGDKVVRQNVELSDLEEGTPLVLYHYGRYQDGNVRLCVFLKIREGKNVIIKRIKIPEDEIIIDDSAFVYEVKNGKVVSTGLSKDEFWKNLFKDRFNLDLKTIIDGE